MKAHREGHRVVVFVPWGNSRKDERDINWSAVRRALREKARRKLVDDFPVSFEETEAGVRASIYDPICFGAVDVGAEPVPQDSPDFDPAEEQIKFLRRNGFRFVDGAWTDRARVAVLHSAPVEGSGKAWPISFCKVNG